ncbi:MAG TPA: hypothetical protein VMB51_16285 [Solirubrobacteraceae bacterium]|nr:hypothetical protein [Solirubrobacteraceae bacterium]
MSDTSPHIRHRVQLPDGKHVEIVYRDHRRADGASRANPSCASQPVPAIDEASAAVPPPSTAAAQGAAEASSALSPSATAPGPTPLSPPAAIPLPAPGPSPATTPPSGPVPPAPVLPPAATTAAQSEPATPGSASGAAADESRDGAGTLEPGAQAEPLHVCFNCGGELVYPLDWIEEGERHWRIILRCPECEAYREGVFEQAIVECLDDELDRATGELLSDLRQITHANMTDEIEFFVRALEADVIGPADFHL